MAMCAAVKTVSSYFKGQGVKHGDTETASAHICFWGSLSSTQPVLDLFQGGVGAGEGLLSSDAWEAHCIPLCLRVQESTVSCQPVLGDAGTADADGKILTLKQVQLNLEKQMNRDNSQVKQHDLLMFIMEVPNTAILFLIQFSV